METSLGPSFADDTGNVQDIRALLARHSSSCIGNLSWKSLLRVVRDELRFLFVLNVFIKIVQIRPNCRTTSAQACYSRAG